MMKLINRLLILAVIAFGVWFIVRHWDSVEVPVVENQDEITLETEVIQDEGMDSTLSFDEEDQSEEPEEKLTITVAEETPVVPVQPVVSSPKVVPVATPVVSAPGATPVNTVLADSSVRVYLYDGGFDISTSSIPAGHVTFTVRNDGRMSHSFAVQNVEEFGRVKPGTSQTFTLDLTTGEYVLYSSAVFDQTLDMRETLRVENAQ